jgi:hypothetical protein
MLAPPLTTNDKIDIRENLRMRLSQPPFSAATLFQAFAVSYDTYKDMTEPSAPMETPDEVGQGLASCMSYVDD